MLVKGILFLMFPYKPHKRHVDFSNPLNGA